MRSYNCKNELLGLHLEHDQNELWRALTQRMRPTAVGRIIEAMMPAAAASMPLPGQVDDDEVPMEEVTKAADADVDVVD